MLLANWTGDRLLGQCPQDTSHMTSLVLVCSVELMRVGERIKVLKNPFLL